MMHSSGLQEQRTNVTSVSATANDDSPSRSSCCERGDRDNITDEVNRNDPNGNNSVTQCSAGQNLSLALEDRELWTRFQCITNEMIVTKNGRCAIRITRLYLSHRVFYYYHSNK